MPVVAMSLDVCLLIVLYGVFEAFEVTKGFKLCVFSCIDMGQSHLSRDAG